MTRWIALLRAINVGGHTVKDEQCAGRLLTRKTEIDDFHIHQREVYWLCRKKQSESTFSNAILEKITGQPSTLRGASTIRKLAEKYPPA